MTAVPVIMVEMETTRFHALPISSALLRSEGARILTLTVPVARCGTGKLPDIGQAESGRFVESWQMRSADHGYIISVESAAALS